MAKYIVKDHVRTMRVGSAVLNGGDDLPEGVSDSDLKLMLGQGTVEEVKTKAAPAPAPKPEPVVQKTPAPAFKPETVVQEAPAVAPAFKKKSYRKKKEA